MNRPMIIIRDLAIIDQLRLRDQGVSPTAARRMLLELSSDMQAKPPKRVADESPREGAD